MPTAIISDIHGNLDALHVVLADIDRRGIKRILCLGDIIGYGPDPCECLELVIARCEWSLMGNHDFAVLYEPTSFNASAEASAYWTRRQIEQEDQGPAQQRYWEYLGNLRIRESFQGVLCVHASPRRPINEYIFPDDVVTAPSKMISIFDRVERAAFVGHTHVPGVFTDEPDFYPPADLGDNYRINVHEKCVINPGSVGQPRDRDPRASYAIMYDPDEDDSKPPVGPPPSNPEAPNTHAAMNGEPVACRVEFIRLEYEIEAVVAKVQEISELNDFLALRLLEGR